MQKCKNHLCTDISRFKRAAYRRIPSNSILKLQHLCMAYFMLSEVRFSDIFEVKNLSMSNLNVDITAKNVISRRQPTICDVRIKILNIRKSLCNLRTLNLRSAAVASRPLCS